MSERIVPPAAVRPPLELWAGPECSVNRVGERFFDQLEATGFAHRLDDLDRLASLGIRRLRFPLLWERTAPDGFDHADWRWSDERLARLRTLGVVPIAGLLHHGSGPRDTHLLDPAFPDRLAAYASAVASRYPDLTAYTPVNEPVTTARFAGLYGLWYPHRADDRSFVRALLNEVQGTVRAMRAIRVVNPDAQLVQTDDLGHTRSTPALAYQAEFDNQRRWLGFDLLCGRVDRQHPLRKYLLANGAGADELDALVDAPCPPDIVGLNAYVTSERFLDDRLAHYPRPLHGGNGRDAYADVEAVRVCGEPIGGFAARLREAHERYRLPLAITEAHLGCTREEQLRWLRDAWAAAEQARTDGIDVRAVTAWAAFGALDWDSLLTEARGHHEPGLWDTRAPQPRPTALATLARELAEGHAPSHPALQGPGWWQRDVRLLYPAHGAPQHRPVEGAPLLIAGATGTLGRAFARLCALRGLPHRLLRRDELDIADPANVRAALERWQPWALVNTAGYVRVDDAEHDSERQWRENAIGPAVLAAECAQAGVRLLTFSSDLVFDGGRSLPYEEHHPAAPLNAYGRAKLAAEREVMTRGGRQALVIRTAAFFGPWDPHNFAVQGLGRLASGESWIAAADQIVSPTYVPDLVHGALDLLIDGEYGLWHLANDDALSWSDFALRLAEAARLPTRQVLACPAATLGQRAPRPAFSALQSARTRLMPALDDAIACFVDAWHATDAPQRAAA